MKKPRLPPTLPKPIWLDNITVTSKDVTCVGKKPIWLDYALAWTLPYSGPGKKNPTKLESKQLMELYKQTLIKNYPTEIPVVYLNPRAVAIASHESIDNEPLELTVPYVTKEILWLPNDSTTMHVPHAAYWWDTALGQSRYLYERAWHNPMYRVISTIHLPYNAHHQVNRIYHPRYQTLVLHVRGDWQSHSPLTQSIPTSWFKQLELTTASRKLRDPRAIHLAIGAAKAKDPAALISVAKAFIYSFK